MQLGRSPKALGQALVVVGGTLIARGLGTLSSFLLAIVLGPSGMGVWATLRLIPNYGTLNHLGALEACRREHPRHRATEEWEELRRLDAHGLGHALFTSSLLALTLAIVFTALRVSGEGNVLAREWGPASLFAAALVPITVGTFLTDRLASSGAFAQVSRVRASRGILYLLCLPAGAFLGGTLGASVGFLLAESGVTLVGLRSQTEPLPRPRLNLAASRKLVRSGAPITLLWWTLILLGTLDRLVVVSFLGEESAGYYALAAMVASLFLVLPEVLSKVISPALHGSVALGHSDPLARLRPHVFLLGWIQVPFLVAAALLVPVLLDFALPRYGPSGPVASILILGCSFGSMIPIGIEALVAVGRQRRFLALAPLALLLQVALTIGAARAGLGIEGVAWGTLLSNGFLMALIWGQLFRSRPWFLVHVIGGGVASTALVTLLAS